MLIFPIMIFNPIALLVAIPLAYSGGFVPAFATGILYVLTFWFLDNGPLRILGAAFLGIVVMTSAVFFFGSHDPSRGGVWMIVPGGLAAVVCASLADWMLKQVKRGRRRAAREPLRS